MVEHRVAVLIWDAFHHVTTTPAVMDRAWWRLAAAPMVNQSDVPFRLTAVQCGATSTWTCVFSLRRRGAHHADKCTTQTCFMTATR